MKELLLIGMLSMPNAQVPVEPQGDIRPLCRYISQVSKDTQELRQNGYPNWAQLDVVIRQMFVPGEGRANIEALTRDVYMSYEADVDPVYVLNDSYIKCIDGKGTKL